MERPPVKTMLEHALPIMRELAGAIGQSCHLAVRSGAQMVVIARIESPGQIGFSVRIGYRRSLATTASGTILFAFQSLPDRLRWRDSIATEATAEQIAQLYMRADMARERGYERADSSFTIGITDISAPILRGESAAAALTVPFVHSTPLTLPIEDVIKRLCDSASQLSGALLAADHRV